jgi:hypothetical protein
VGIRGGGLPLGVLGPLDAVLVTEVGNIDSFTVRVSSDGMSFTTYQDGAIYQTGVRKR